MYIGDQTTRELAYHFEEESLAVIPIGSTEQHGPHLPISTDHRIAEAIARKATDQTGHLCTPTVNFGISSHHRQFHGTMWTEPSVFRDQIESLSRNLAYYGIDRLVYVNAHGGNVEALREVARKLHADETAFAVEWMWTEAVSDLTDELFERRGPHGGPKETSMMMHIDEDLVHEDRLEEASGGNKLTADDDRRHQGAKTGFDFVEVTDNGVFGDQTDATPEKGKRLFQASTRKLIEVLEWLDGCSDEELKPEPHVDPYSRT